jgi:hypothetical protein
MEYFVSSLNDNMTRKGTECLGELCSDSILEDSLVH